MTFVNTLQTSSVIYHNIIDVQLKGTKKHFHQFYRRAKYKSNFSSFFMNIVL